MHGRIAAYRADLAIRDAQELEEALVLLRRGALESLVPAVHLARREAARLQHGHELLAAHERERLHIAPTEEADHEALLLAERVDLLVQRREARSEDVGDVGAAALEQPMDDPEREPRLSVAADPLQAPLVVARVPAVARRRPVGGAQQPDPVVVEERAAREPVAARELADGGAPQRWRRRAVSGLGSFVPVLR